MKENTIQRTANQSEEGGLLEDQSPRWLWIREAAAELRVSETTVRSWLSTGKLEGYKIGGVVRVDREAIDKLGKTHPYLAPVSQGRPSGLARLGRTLRGKAS